MSLSLKRPVEAQQGVVQHVSVDQLGVQVLLDVVLIPDEVGVVLDGSQVACLPPVGEGHLLQLRPVGADHVVDVLIKVLGRVPAITFSHLG